MNSPSDPSPRRRLKILLSEGSSTSARQTLYALGRLGHAIDVCDSQRLALCRFSRYVRRWHRCPPFASNPADYLRFITCRLSERRYDVLFPVHDQVLLFSRFREDLRRRVGLAVADFDSMRTVLNKASFTRLLRQLKLPQPETAIVPGVNELDQDWDFPCFVKLSHGTAGRGVWKVRDSRELQRAIADIRALDSKSQQAELLVQQPAEGDLCVAQTVFQHGQLAAFHGYRAREFGAGGSAVARESVSHAVVREQVARLGAHLNWHGAMHLEYFYDPSRGEPSYIDANPRIGETMNATLSGVNLCDALLRVSLDEPVDPPLQPQTGLRTHAVITRLLGVAEDGKGRGELLRELLRAWRRSGIYRNSQEELTRTREDVLSLIPAAAVAVQLLVAPRSARKLIQGAVGNYGLNETGVHKIEELPADLLADIEQI